MIFSQEFLDIAFNAIGILGVSLIIFAYFLIIAEKVKSDDLRYCLLNLFGAVFLLISLLRFWNLASVVIELFWIAISLYGIRNYYQKKTSKMSNPKEG